MTNKYIGSGDKQSIVAAGAVTQGSIYVGTSRAGVYLETATTGDLVAVAFRGVFTVTKQASQAWTNGQAIYATSAGVATTTVGSNTFLGYAWGEVDNAASSVTGAVDVRS